MPTFLTRRVTFTAAHRYWRDDWSDEVNRRVFGEVDHVTGMIVDLALLDRVVDAEVTERFDHREVNLDVPEFSDGSRCHLPPWEQPGDFAA